MGVIAARESSLSVVCAFCGALRRPPQLRRETLDRVSHLVTAVAAKVITSVLLSITDIKSVSRAGRSSLGMSSTSL
jgi:hypothetical protein